MRIIDKLNMLADRLMGRFVPAVEAQAGEVYTVQCFCAEAPGGGKRVWYVKSCQIQMGAEVCSACNHNGVAC